MEAIKVCVSGNRDVPPRILMMKLASQVHPTSEAESKPSLDAETMPKSRDLIPAKAQCHHATVSDRLNWSRAVAGPLSRGDRGIVEAPPDGWREAGSFGTPRALISALCIA